VIIAAGLIQGAQVAKEARGPELARTFEASLVLVTGGFHRSTADRPATLGDRLIVQAPGVTGKIVLLFAHDRRDRTAGHLQRRDLL
jgi:hypothetical protein